MPYIGNTPTSQNFVPQVDYFNGTGAQVAFTLSRSVASVSQIAVVVNNVIQNPNSFTVLGSTLTFSEAPSVGTGNVWVQYTSLNQSIMQPGYQTVGMNQIDSGLQSAIGGMGFKNRIINGAMMIDQRNAGASVVNTSIAYPVDRFFIASNAGDSTVQRSTIAPSGFVNSLKVTTTATKTVSSSTYSVLVQRIEGNNMADFAFGTANAQTFTLSFWVNSSKTGIFSVSFKNNGTNYCYVTNYTINSANTWELKTLTVSGATGGSWTTDNTSGMEVGWWLAGANTQASSTGSWLVGNQNMSASQSNLYDAVGATFYITGVQLEKGSTATSFDYRPYGTELALCQRYYQKGFAKIAGGVYNGQYGRMAAGLKVSMRAAPTVSLTANCSINFAGVRSETLGLATSDSSTDTILATFGAAANSYSTGQVCSNDSENVQASAEL